MTGLYHWTCACAAANIRTTRTVRVHMNVSWWTDLAQPGKRTRFACGLSSNLLTCDRMQYRCLAADPSLLIHWMEYRCTLPARHVADLENAPGAQPDHWWVAEGPVPVRSIRRMNP